MTKYVLGILAFVSCHLVIAQKSIELDHTRPSIKVLEGGNVGIEAGYYNPGSQLQGYHLSIGDESSGTERIHLYGGDQGTHPFMEFVDGNGDASVTIWGYGYGQSQTLGRIITDQLEIKAGSDLAEYFDITAEAKIEPGMITSIDPQNAGRLKVSQGKYDKKVVGVVSGANGLSPGMFMGQKETIAHGSHPIALTGRAYVYASDENGHIQPGDFLTTSSTPGYAMKAIKIKKARGAIIGKAMSPIDENGFVLVLINLQ